MPRYFKVAYLIIFLFISYNSCAQVYHFETGKSMGTSKPNTIVWNNGVFNNYPAKFGTLIVKENRHDRNTRLINIPVIVVKAIEPNDSLAPIFILHGGPGESNLQNHLFFESLAQKRDMVFVGYRGVDGSVKLNCPCYADALKSDTLTLENAELVFKKAAESCFNQLTANKIDIKGYSMDEVVSDIEITRQILKYDSINFLAFSYGTMLAQLYARSYDSLINKMILLGARPLDNFLFEGEVLNEQLVDLYTTRFKIRDTDTVNNSIQKGVSILNKIIDMNPSLNHYRLYFFCFSKLYTIQDVDNLYLALKLAYKGNSVELIKQYDEFYKNFPGDLVLGDVVIKKQGKVILESNGKTFSSDHLITNCINNFYAPHLNLLENNTREKVSSNTNFKIIRISGDFDFASPKQIWFEGDYNKKKSIEIPDAGHLDLFYKDKIIINNYFNNIWH